MKKKNGGTHMREIKFRGKSDLSMEELEEAGVPHKNGWVVGQFIGDSNLPLIVGPIVGCSDEGFNVKWWASVIPETVGQCTGLKDMNDIDVVIYEGDIGYDYHDDVHGIVKFDEGKFIYDVENVSEDLFEVADEIEISGNSWDNSELLGVN